MREIKVFAMHDLSGYGRCSLTVIIPVMSSFGIQVVPAPTAILSTHTGGFEGYSFIDLTDNIYSQIDHYKKMGLRFDCFYSGFLANDKQIEAIHRFKKNFKDTLVVIDPVFADNGKIYSSFDEKIILAMRYGIKNADIITPNMTEALMLTGKKWEESISYDTALDTAYELSSYISGNIVIITGVRIAGDEKNIYTLLYDKGTKEIYKTCLPRINEEYPGTGDLFTSVFLSHVLTGSDYKNATSFACEYVFKALSITKKENTPLREGLLIEKMINRGE